MRLILGLLGDDSAEFGASVDTQLAVDPGQVSLDGLRADEHHGGDVAVGQSRGGEFCDALFRRSEQSGGVGGHGSVPARRGSVRPQR